jgi:hypothetical protein
MITLTFHWIWILIISWIIICGHICYRSFNSDDDEGCTGFVLIILTIIIGSILGGIYLW